MRVNEYMYIPTRGSHIYKVVVTKVDSVRELGKSAKGFWHMLDPRDLDLISDPRTFFMTSYISLLVKPKDMQCNDLLLKRSYMA